MPMEQTDHRQIILRGDGGFHPWSQQRGQAVSRLCRPGIVHLGRFQRDLPVVANRLVHVMTLLRGSRQIKEGLAPGWVCRFSRGNVFQQCSVRCRVLKWNWDIVHHGTDGPPQ